MREVAEYSKNRISANYVDTTNYVGVDNLLTDKKGKKISAYVPNNNNLTMFNSEDILIGNIRPYLKKIWFSNLTGGTNGDVLVICVTDKKIMPKYLYYVLSSDNFFDYDTQYSKGGKMPRGDKQKIMQYKIPIPPLSEQERIVSILDRFDKLCNDITEGLPAEINARQKQYEYYRDKILNFKI